MTKKPSKKIALASKKKDVSGKPRIGIIGVGWIGTPLLRYFQEFKKYELGKDLFTYDILPEKCSGDINDADVIFVCLPTPRNPKDGSCDLSIIAENLPKIKGEKIVVLKSTIAPGTTEFFQAKYPAHKFLFNPEFLTESQAWLDFVRPNRQIVGFTGKSLDAAHLVLSLLPKAPFMSPWGTNTYSQTRITATEAEIIKYAANVYFARKVVWANVVADIADRLGADYENIRLGMASDHRIGDSHLDVHHGGYRGFGGYCFPKDLSALLAFAKNLNLADAVEVMQSDWHYNEKLLARQGLSISDVSRHFPEIKLKLPKSKSRTKK